MEEDVHKFLDNREKQLERKKEKAIKARNAAEESLKELREKDWDDGDHNKRRINEKNFINACERITRIEAQLELMEELRQVVE